MLNAFENYIFDLDGTLVNSSEEVLLCLRKAFAQAGVEFEADKMTSDVIGPPLKQIMQNLAPDIREEEMTQVMSNFRRIYDYDAEDISVLYPDIEDLLKTLKSGGKRLFIATFKPQIPTLRLVEKFFPNTFEDVYTIDKFGQPITKEEMIKDIVSKYGLEKSKTVMIGDAPSDVMAGKNAGVNTIGVLWGYGSDKTKLIECADCVISSVKEAFFCGKA